MLGELLKFDIKANFILDQTVCFGCVNYGLISLFWSKTFPSILRLLDENKTM